MLIHFQSLRTTTREFNDSMFNQSCILCKQYSATIICNTCKFDCETVVKHVPSEHHPVLVDIQDRAMIQQLTILNWYAWPLDELIHLVKFKLRPQFCRLLSQWFITFAFNNSNVLRPDALIAMPQGKWKHFTRGYNPAGILTQHLCKQLSIQNLSKHLHVASSLIDQRSLSRTKRLQRKKRFIASRLPASVSTVVIVDDITTTGSTLRLAATALQEANPNLKIHAWCLAATPPTGMLS
jgi:ComF family protein